MKENLSKCIWKEKAANESSFWWGWSLGASSPQAHVHWRLPSDFLLAPHTREWHKNNLKTQLFFPNVIRLFVMLQKIQFTVLQTVVVYAVPLCQHGLTAQSCCRDPVGLCCSGLIQFGRFHLSLLILSPSLILHIDQHPIDRMSFSECDVHCSCRIQCQDT